jgi:membrane-bound serine protease (ClpP class)
MLVRFFPETSFFRRLVSQTASGVSSGAAREEQQEACIGQSGVAIPQLYPGGKARFGEQILDVLTEGESEEKGRRVKITKHTGSDAVVKEVSLIQACAPQGDLLKRGDVQVSLL